MIRSIPPSSLLSTTLRILVIFNTALHNSPKRHHQPVNTLTTDGTLTDEHKVKRMTFRGSSLGQKGPRMIWNIDYKTRAVHKFIPIFLALFYVRGSASL